MSALHKSIRFAIVANLYFIALVSMALPALGNAASDQASARFSTVLAPGQEPRQGLTSLFKVPNGINGSFELDGKIVSISKRGAGLARQKFSATATGRRLSLRLTCGL